MVPDEVIGPPDNPVPVATEVTVPPPLPPPVALIVTTPVPPGGEMVTFVPATI